MLTPGVMALVVVLQAASTAPLKGIRLDRLAWLEAEEVLRPETVVVIPVGGASVQHGPHLKLGTDFVLAEYLAQRVSEASAVVVAPALPYHYYPAFAEYPGSTSLTLESARHLVVDAVRSLARSGPRRFYVLNTGVGTEQALKPAAAALAGDGILLRFLDVDARLAQASASVREQDGGRHADEVETSLMLHIDASAVDMKQAGRDLAPASRPFRLTRSLGGEGTHSPSGIWGDATLATRQKGAVIADALVKAIVDDIERLRSAPLPAIASPTTPRTGTVPLPLPSAPGSAAPAATCTPGDERAIRRIADAFTVAWNNQNHEELALLWSREGDIVHPDGLVERGIQVIMQNRRELFTRREYRHSRHPLTLGNVRCLAPDVAVTDGKWELRGVTDSAGRPLPIMEGLISLVVKRHGGWLIEAYRYTFKPPVATIPPSILKRPGYPSGPR